MKRKKEVRELQKKPENNKPVLVSPCLLTLTLNVNGLNSPIKRHRQDGWIKTKKQKTKKQKKKTKQDPTICCLQETHFSFKDTHRLKVKG